MQFRYNEQRNFRPTCSLYRGLTRRMFNKILSLLFTHSACTTLVAGENRIARDVSVKSLNNSLFQSGLFSSEKKDETRDFLERSWSDVSTRDFLKYKAKSLIINMSEKI
ncbi:hypothetical protein BpHYR1_030997 [Brachionus plicatilis]|uniref:Uncharacterized protein n=1 Tax=Brachionus plicatilis TaxID=10195 RepID=A0A3M7T6K7_BRAPC|nr:hypothetical protein BpHYR1_030997 [Brachionus plicatilis]